MSRDVDKVTNFSFANLLAIFATEWDGLLTWLESMEHRTRRWQYLPRLERRWEIPAHAKLANHWLASTWIQFED